MKLLTADILNSLENGSTTPVIISNGINSWFVYLWKNDEGTNWEVYTLFCQNDETGIEQNANALDNNFVTLSYEDFTSLDNTSCNIEAGYLNALTNTLNNMFESMQLTLDGINEESPSDEDTTKKAIYYYSE